MIVLRAIGGFFAKIGRWIRDTAWIQPLLIVGGIFAIIFAIPNIIDAVESWFDESDAANRFYVKYQLSLSKADIADKDNPFIGSSKVDELLTYVEDAKDDTDVKAISKKYGSKFFVMVIEEDNSTCQDIYGGFKVLKDKWNSNSEFSTLKGDSFKLYTIYKDSISTEDDETNLFSEVWLNHYSFFESLSAGNYLDQTYYAQNKGYTANTYAEKFTADSSEDTCPVSVPTLFYFDYTDSNLIATENQKVRGLSDILFGVDGSSDLDKARTLRDCWTHSAKSQFGAIED